MNLNLKKSLIDRGIPAYRTAMEAGINPNRVSKFICGLAKPTQSEMEVLAKLLNKPIDDLFPSEPVEA